MMKECDKSYQVDWYFDFISPFAYLQHEIIKKRYPDIQLKRIPILFAALLKQHGHKGPAEIPEKRIMTYRHCQWIANREGIPFRFPPEHPFVPLAALRLCIAAGATREAVDRIFQSTWARGESPVDPEVLVELGKSLGLEETEAAISQDDVKAVLRDNTNQAIERGVFGVPTIDTGRQLFWGFDMTEFVAEHLHHPENFDSDEYRRISELPSGLKL